MQTSTQIEVPPDGTRVVVEVSEDHHFFGYREARLEGLLMHGGHMLRLTRCNHEFGACELDEYPLRLNGGRWGLRVESLEVAP